MCCIWDFRIKPFKNVLVLMNDKITRTTVIWLIKLSVIYKKGVIMDRSQNICAYATILLFHSYHVESSVFLVNIDKKWMLAQE